MGLDDLKARLENLLASHTRAPDARARAQGLHAAMVEFKTSLAENKQARAAAERELAGERRQLEDAIRRGGLIAPILIAPLSIPVLIFGTGSITASQSGAAMLFLAALSLMAVALAPFTAALAISSGED